MANTENKTEYKSRKKKRKPIFLLLFIFAAFFLTAQAYAVNYNKIDTVKAAEGYINDSIVAQGIVCRTEVLLTRSSGGVVDYLVSDGERISKSNLVANVYSSKRDVEKMHLIRDKQKIKDNFDTLIGYSTGGTFDVSVTKKQLSSRICELSRMTAAKDYRGLSDVLIDLSLNLNRIDVATGEETDYNAAKAVTDNEIARLSGGVGGIAESLYSSKTGYFIGKADGYENIRKVRYFETVSAEEGESIISSPAEYPVDNGVYGKVITDYKWDLCLYIDTDKAENLYVGKTVNISISVPDNEYYKGTVTKLIEQGDKTFVAVQCSVMTPGARSKRITDCEILFKQYTGIKIPKTALHFEKRTDENGNTYDAMGVYVIYSNVVQFKRVTPLCEDDKYVIVPLNTEKGTNEVKLYDSIVVKGRNLYDGKYL